MWIWINFIKFWGEMIEGHGDDLYRYSNITANFSSNVYNEVEHAPLWKHLKERMECMVSYPEPQPYTLEGAIAESCGVAGENVCVTNWATEAIYLIAQCFAGCTSVIFVPTFSEYAD
jgi:threonine-phosphate decarboxylase